MGRQSTKRRGISETDTGKHETKKYYIINSERYRGWYCGKCGKKLPMDRYNGKKHAEACWSGADYETEFILEGADQIYNLTACPGKVVLTLSLPLIKRIPGFQDRFEGMERLKTFEVVYKAGSKIPEVTYDPAERGLESVLHKIRQGRFRRGEKANDAEILHSVFPSVIAVESLEMFDFIYRHKGFCAERKIPPAVEERLLGTLPGDGDGSCEKKESKAADLKVTSYRYRGETVILRAVLRKRGEQTVFLFSRGYAACSDMSRVPELLETDCRLTEGSANAIRSFDKAYPEYMLGRYAERSDNILIPLLAADYHCGMELAAKAGAAGVAENCRQLEAFDRHPSEYGNLKKLFGIPAGILRVLGRETATTANIERMKEVFEYNPQLLCFDFFTPSMIEYLHRADITHKRQGNMITETGGFSDRQNLRILRYLSGHPEEGHYFCDYLSACYILGEFPYGLTPAIPIREAHDRTVLRIRNNRNETLKLNFRDQVGSIAYQRLTTCVTEEDEERFEEDAYMVTAPCEPDDLFMESQNMHNCVRIYTDSVARGQCKIYFLRKKKEPDKSFGTIEVSGDGSRLIQAKAFANRKLTVSAQRYVRKWCVVKGIRISTGDITVR